MSAGPDRSQLPPNEDAPTTTGPLVVVVALVLSVLTSYSINAVPVLGARLGEHFGLAQGGLGALLSCAAIGSLVALPLVGPGTGLLGPRRFLQACLLTAAAGMALCGAARTVLLFEAGLIVAGGAGAATSVALPAYLIVLYPHLRRRMVTLSLLVLVAPGMVFPVLAQALLGAEERGLLGFAAIVHSPFWVLALIAAGGQFLLGLDRSGVGARAKEAAERFDPRHLLSLPALAVIACATVHSAADNSLFQWMPTFVTTRFEHPAIAPGMVLALYCAAYVISRGVLTMLPEGVGQRLMLVLTGPIGGGILIAAIWLGDSLTVGLAYPIAGLLVALEYPALISGIRSSSTTHFATVYAGAMWASALMTVAGINFIGQIGERTGDLRIGLTAAALGFVAFGLIALVSGLGRARAD